MNKITFRNGQAPYINDTNLNLMQTNIENAITNLKQIIWTGSATVKTTMGQSITLNNMPDLTDYIGKTINFYFAYGSDALTKFSIMLTNETTSFFYTHMRNHNGNDVWLIVLGFKYINSNTWNVGTCISSCIGSDNSISTDDQNNNLKLYKIEVEV